MFRRLTPLVRTCLLAGTFLGAILGLYLSLGVPPGQSGEIGIGRVDPRVAPFYVPCLAAVGGIVGVGVGIGVGWAFAEKREAERNKPWWKRGKSSRRKG